MSSDASFALNYGTEDPNYYMKAALGCVIITKEVTPLVKEALGEWTFTIISIIKQEHVNIVYFVVVLII